MSINTQKGWNQAAIRINSESFAKANGRPPHNTQELQEWVRKPKRK